MVRFMHTADWQLGMRRWFLSAEAQARFDTARLDAISTMGRIAKEKKCAFILVCGDVFDSNHEDRRVVVRALEALAAVKLPVYLLAGNHDALEPGNVYQSRTFVDHKPDNVTVIGNTEPLQIAAGVELIGAPWTSKRPLEDLVAKAVSTKPQKAAVISIIAGHGAVDTLSPDPNNPAVIRVASAEAAIQKGLIHYLALGDRHSVTKVGSSGRIYYSGAPEPTDFDETGPGNVLIVELSEGQCNVEQVCVATWQFVRYAGGVHSAEDISALDSRLASQPNKDRTIMQLDLKGTLSIAARAALDQLLDHNRDLFASLILDRSSDNLVTLPEDEDFSELGLSGYASAAVGELRATALGAGAQAKTARDALALLYRLVRFEGGAA